MVFIRATVARHIGACYSAAMSTIIAMILDPAGRDSAEHRALLHASMLADLPVVRVAMSGLVAHAEALRSGSAVPAGSVEYVREALRVAGVAEPPPLSYPEPLLPYLGRRVELSGAGQLAGRCFVKPRRTKLFTGFVFDAAAAPGAYTDHDREQLVVLQSLPPDEPVWCCDVVQIVGEWRYYVLRDVVLGRGRYDPDGADDAPQPDEATVGRAVHAMRALGIVAYSLDVGVLADGRTVVVEANDAWALGLYERAIRPAAYWEMLRTRWLQIGGHDRAAGWCVTTLDCARC